MAPIGLRLGSSGLGRIRVIVRAGELRPEGLPINLNLHIGPLGYEGGLEIGVAGATLKALVKPSRRGLACTGRLVATAFVPCSRCLEPFAYPVDRDFEISFLPAMAVEGPENQDHQITLHDSSVSYLDERGSFDVTDVAAEQIYLALPMKPLCAPDCRGLCPVCGANLNSERCGCREAAG